MQLQAARRSPVVGVIALRLLAPLQQSAVGSRVSPTRYFMQGPRDLLTWSHEMDSPGLAQSTSTAVATSAARNTALIFWNLEKEGAH